MRTHLLRSMPLRPLGIALFAAVLLLPFVGRALAEDQTFAENKEAPSAVETAGALLQQAAEFPDYEPVWDLGASLVRQAEDEDLRALLREAAASESFGKRLAAGYALLRLGEQRDGSRALEGILVDGQAPILRRIDAATALGTEGGEYSSTRLRRILNDQELPERLQVEVAKALWQLTRAESARVRLTALLDAKSPSARHEAALALAAFIPMQEAIPLLQDLQFQPGTQGRQARQTLIRRARVALMEGEFESLAPHLRSLSEYPTLNVDSAQTLLDVAEWQGVDWDETHNQYAAKLVSEVVGKIERYYPPDLSGSEIEQQRELERLEPHNLANEAVKTFVSRVDPFSAYLDEADLEEMEQQIGGGYGGIGAWVGMRRFGLEERFTILVPMYDQPAFHAGLRAMDWIEKIDGKEIQDMTMREIIHLLKGDPNTQVNLLVHRRSWREPREVVVTRKQISVPSVRSRMLPGDIGYIRLERFGDHRTTGVELREALSRLKDEGMRGLVFDLSNNPGGLLQTAVEVADMFLEKNKLVVYSMGRPDSNLPMHKRRNYFGRGEPVTRLPMVVMVNGGSASASEIVAGALRDHQRATLVGRKTFGKGSIQSLLDVRATGPQTRLKLTVAKYYLPNGDCIHKKGIEPNIKVEPEPLSDDRFEALMDVREQMYVLYYIRDAYEEHAETFRELLTFDDEDLSAYPGAEALRKKIVDAGIDIHPQDLRAEIRRELVTHLESERGIEVVVDPQEDEMLQRAILELRKSVPESGDPPALYAWFAEKLADAEKSKASRKLASEAEATPDE